jgi:Flp pilus assembly protein CpaB
MASKSTNILVISLTLGLAAQASACDSPFEQDAGIYFPTAKVLVAKRTLTVGTVIKDPQKYFEQREILAYKAPLGAISDLEALLPEKLARPVQKGSILVRDDLWGWLETYISLFEVTPLGHIPFPIFHIPDTMGGFLQPNTRVDVLYTCKLDFGGVCSRVIFQKALLLNNEQVMLGKRLLNFSFVAIRPGQILTGFIAGFSGQFRLIVTRYIEENEGA